MLPELLADSLELYKKAHGGLDADQFAREIVARQERYKDRDFYLEAIEECEDAPVYLYLKLLEQLEEWGDGDRWREQRQLTAGAISTAMKLYSQIRHLERSAEE